MRPKFNGLLLVDKPEGLTSHDVVDRLRKIFHMREVGHAGTLDPMATGLLVCLLGEGTKLSPYVMNSDKTYEVTVKLGIRTDSGDLTGKKVEEKDVPELSPERLEGAIKSLVGPIELPVPQYSAVKIKGKKLYEYARSQQNVELPIRTMTINNAELLRFGQDELALKIHCGKGTYIRSWVEKLGENLDTVASVARLRRLSSGHFDVGQAYSLGALEESAGDSNTKLGSAVISLQHALPHWPALRLVGRDSSLVRNGQLPRGVKMQVLAAGILDGVRLLSESNELLALLVRGEEQEVKLGKVFKTASV